MSEHRLTAADLLKLRALLDRQLTAAELKQRRVAFDEFMGALTDPEKRKEYIAKYRLPENGDE